MKSESIIEVLTTATEALRTMKPLLKMPDAEKGAEFQRLAPVVAALRQETRRVCGGLWSPAQHRAMYPWQPEKVKPDLRSDELKALDAEVAQLDGEYKQAVALWERCTLEKINRGSPLITTSTFQIVPRANAGEDAELDRKIATAAALRDKASDKVQAKRARYYALLKEEQGERRAAALRAQQAEQMEAKQRADEARDKSFAADALKFFGLRA